MPSPTPAERAQELGADGEEHVVAEHRSRNEEDRAHDDERDGEMALVAVEPGGDESPRLAEPDRGGDDDGHEEAHLDPEHEVLLRRGGDEAPAVRLDHVPERLHQEVEDLVVEEETPHERHHDGDRRPDEAAAQLVQMLEEGHPVGRPVRAVRPFRVAHGSP